MLLPLPILLMSMLLLQFHGFFCSKDDSAWLKWKQIPDNDANIFEVNVKVNSKLVKIMDKLLKEGFETLIDVIWCLGFREGGREFKVCL